MKTIVVDASVAIKWFIPEVHAIAATRLLHKNLQFIAPDLIFAEVGNILWKKYRSKELTLDTANGILNDFKKLPLNSCASEFLLDTAWQIATAHQCTVYDSLYVALAQSERCLLVTADRVLYNTLSTTHLACILLWVEDIKNIN
ncbi:MAG TPA: type II toxin-antitoxin system VapC family toxin [Gammaproteobacteria bacterium]|nr:type II toxin-antitoxin system VapC family toxin [Gammaproteobacteria bacterium]